MLVAIVYSKAVLPGWNACGVNFRECISIHLTSTSQRICSKNQSTESGTTIPSDCKSPGRMRRVCVLQIRCVTVEQPYVPIQGGRHCKSQLLWWWSCVIDLVVGWVGLFKGTFFCYIAVALRKLNSFDNHE